MVQMVVTNLLSNINDLEFICLCLLPDDLIAHWQGCVGAAAVAARALSTTSQRSAAAGSAEVSSILEDRILGQSSQANMEETGRVLSIGDGIARVYGINNIQAEEMVECSYGLKVLYSKGSVQQSSS